MRKIVIEVETDDIDSIEEIKRDIENELSCCSTSFDFDTLEVYDKADTPQTETQMKTQNSNLPFEKQTEEPPMDEYYKDHDEFYEPQERSSE